MAEKRWREPERCREQPTSLPEICNKRVWRIAERWQTTENRRAVGFKINLSFIMGTRRLTVSFHIGETIISYVPILYCFTVLYTIISQPSRVKSDVRTNVLYNTSAT